MQEMLGTEDVCRRAFFYRIDCDFQERPPPRRIGVFTDRGRVIDGRDSRSRAGSVMRQDSGERCGPEHAGPRLQVFLDIVGMQFHQSGDEIGAFAVLPLGRTAAQRVDTPVLNGHVACNNGIRRYQLHIGKRKFGHAAAWNSVTSSKRVAMASRTGASWQMATRAEPAARASLISATTVSRLAASSEAVGSSNSTMG